VDFPQPGVVMTSNLASRAISSAPVRTKQDSEQTWIAALMRP